jgi:hypothetical protein
LSGSVHRDVPSTVKLLILRGTSIAAEADKQGCQGNAHCAYCSKTGLIEHRQANLTVTKEKS